MFAHETARILSVSGGLQSDGFIAANIHNYATPKQTDDRAIRAAAGRSERLEPVKRIPNDRRYGVFDEHPFVYLKGAMNWFVQAIELCKAKAKINL